MLRPGFEPTSVELHRPRTFWRTLYWLSYRTLLVALCSRIHIRIVWEHQYSNPGLLGEEWKSYLWALLLPIQNCLSLLIKIRKSRRLAFPFFVLTHLNLPLIYIFPKFESSLEENTQKSFLLNFQFIPKVKFYAWVAIVAIVEQR